MRALGWRGVIEEYREFLPVTSTTPVVSQLQVQMLPPSAGSQGRPTARHSIRSSDSGYTVEDVPWTPTTPLSTALGGG